MTRLIETWNKTEAALYEKMGDDWFNTFMQTYFNKYRYGIAYMKDV